MNQHARLINGQRRQARQLMMGIALSVSLFAGGATLASASSAQPAAASLNNYAPVCNGTYDDPPDCRPIKPEEPGPKGGKLKKRPPSGGGITPEDPGPKTPPRTPENPKQPPITPPAPKTPRTITSNSGGHGPFVAQHLAIPATGGNGWQVTAPAAPQAVAAPAAVAAMPDTGVGAGDLNNSLMPALLALAGAGAAASMAVASRQRPALSKTR